MDAQFDTEKFNALMKLADFRFQRWRERRTTDWKLSLALWTLLVVGAASAKAHGRFEFPGWATALVLIILVIGHAWFWVRSNFIASAFDIKNGFHFADHAVKIVLPTDPVPIEPRPDPNKSQGWFEFLTTRGFCQAQMFATALFAFVAFVILVYG
jgi:hypothetical protein